MNIFILGPVRKVTKEYLKEMSDYAISLKEEGHQVHLPIDDTNQNASGIEICTQNGHAIALADEVHVFYTKDSLGSHFDLGVAFALGKEIKIIATDGYGPNKSFSRMIAEWEQEPIKPLIPVL